MANQIIEERAVNAVKDRMMDLHVQADIMSNDKTPVIDGNLFLYSSPFGKEFANEDLIGKIPIQVKGTTKEANKNGEYKFNLSQGALEAIDKVGGVELFVVHVQERKKESVIYFRELSRLVVQRMLRQMHGNRSKGIKVYEFPEDHDSVFSELLRARDQIESQGTVYNVDLNLKPKKVRLRTYGNENLIDALKKSEMTVYALIDGNEIPYSSIDPDTSHVFETKKVKVKFENSETIFDSELRFNEDLFEIVTGNEKKITIDLKRNSNQLTIHWDKTSTISHQKMNVEALLSLIEKKDMYIDDKKMELEWKINAKKYSKLRDHLQLVKLRLVQMERLKKATHLPFFDDTNSEKEEQVLESILIAYMEPAMRKEAIMYREKIGGKVYNLISVASEKGQHRVIQSVFSRSAENFIKMKYTRDGGNTVVNPYTYGLDDLENIGDFNPDLVWGWYERHEISSEVQAGMANDYSFYLLRAYSNTQNPVFLELAIKIAKMTFEYSPEEDSEFLNYVQAIKRKNANLEIEQIQRLMNIYQEDEPVERFAAGLLLNVSAGELFEDWRKIGKQNQLEFEKLPIFDFATDELAKKISNSNS